MPTDNNHVGRVMALYRFKVSDSTGALSEMLIEGDSQADATRRLQRRGALPIEFLGEGSLSADTPGRLGLRQKFDILDFTDRLVPLIEAGIPLERALGVVGEGVESKLTARVVGDLRRGLHEGRKFSELIRARGRMFPPLYASIVEAGEEAGALPQVMRELHRFLQESRELRAFIVSAAIYPLFIVGASCAMLAVLFGVVVPRFASVLRSLGRDELPLATRLLVFGSELVRGYWWCAPIIAVLAVLLIVQVQRGGRARAFCDNAILSVPLAAKMVVWSNLARMARTMSILMRSGVHLLDVVSIASRVVQNATLRRSISGLAGELRQGQRLSHALGHSRFIPPFMLRMVAVGEETGSVESMLERVAERYETDLRRAVKRLLSLLEPIIIICLGVFVALVVLTMFMAIMDIQGGI